MTINNEHKKLNVPNLRFPEFQGEWEKCRLGDVCTFLSGGTPKIDVKEYWNGTIPFVSAISMHDTYILDSKLHISEEGLKHGSRLLTKNNLLLLVRGSMLWNTIPICLNKNDVAFNQDVKGIIANDTIINEFLLYWLKSKEQHLKYMVTGTGLGAGKLDTSDLLSMIIYIPAMIEQDKVARLLSLFDERIATQSKIIDKLQSLIKGISSRIFTSIQGIEYRMGDIVTITNGNSNVQDAVTQSKDGLYPFFDRSEDIKYLPTFLFDKEAIIYPGEGTEFMPRYFKGKFALHQRCYAIFDFNEIINARFLYFYLKTRNSYFVKNAVGSTVPSLRLDTFQKLKVIIPSKEIQHSVSLCLSSMEQKCNVEKKILHKLLKQKQYLLRQMFI